ncbi:MAG TPA: hypothetical protein VM600_07370 [Actinomycetota bacterium]|nr:hypothetical protein [Actinomycetota bacterium]
MRRFILAAAIVGLLATNLPSANAHAGSHNVTFQGAIPCGAVCAYWDGPEAAGYKACENPFPPGSWVDIKTEAAPSPPSGKKVILVLEIFPQVDWDSYICANTSARTELARGTNILGENCDNLAGPDNPVPVGCQEKAQAPAVAGRTYILRAYNWSDAAPSPGKYTWLFV